MTDVLDAIIERVPAPAGDPDAPARALVFDSSYDQYRGVLAFVRVIDGSFSRREELQTMATGTRFDAEELGFFSPTMTPVESLSAGEVGYVVTGLKDVSRLRVGDTITSVARPATEPLPGYKDVKPMVFAGLYPTDSDAYPELRDALERLKLNDGALLYEPEVSKALGFGFRCGFLGLLHMEIVRERLEREFDLDLLVTAPTVAYRVRERHDTDWVELHNPADFPREFEEVEEPYVKASIIVPKEYVGAVMELNNERRGTFDHMEYLSPERVHLTYDLPLGEIVLDYYDQLKSRTRGYASFDYDLAGFKPGKLVRVDVLVGGEMVDALSLIIHRDFAYERGQAARREAARGDSAPDVRRADPGGDRLTRDRARDGEGAPQGRAREVLRRRHLAQAQAAREAEEGQEAHEAGRRGGGAAGGIPRGAQHRAGTEDELMSDTRHLYVHLPFCAHRCGYCDFVTVVGRGEQHRVYVDALLAELELERASLAPELETIFLGGGTPTFTALPELVRLLEALPPAAEITTEANPETVTPELARALRDAGVTRVSLGAQTFRPELLRVLERVAGPDDVRRAVHHLRDAGFDNISLDLIYGIPGQSPSDLAADLADALALEPEHLSCYELEAKPGTRFTHAWADELGRQADAMEDYFERVVATLTGAGYRWYETANFCRDRRGSRSSLAAQPGLLARPRLPRHRHRCGHDDRRPPPPQHAEARALPGGARGRPYARARARAARRRRARARARDARAAPRRAAAARRPPPRTRPRRSRSGREARSRGGARRHA